MNDVLRCSTVGPRVTVTLCRPRMHNALDAGLVAGLIRAFHEAAACEQARYVVLDGEGPSFCAGADLNLSLIHI